MRILIIITVLSALFSSCFQTQTGEEIGRLTINGLNTAEKIFLDEVEIELKRGEKISIWSYMDMEYKADPYININIQHFWEDENLGTISIDPTNKRVSIAERKNVANGTTRWHFLGKNKELTINESGTHTFKVFMTSSYAETLKIYKSELVFKKAI